MNDDTDDTDDTVTLWRPTGPEELQLVEESGWTAWPPRLPDQPIFYPVLNEDYAERIARDWNVKASGVGHVTRFEVRRRFLDDFDVQQAGGRTILEYWIPAEQLDALNAEIVGRITLVSTFRRDDGDGEIRKLTAADEQAPGTADSADGRPTTEPGAPAPSRASAPR